MLNEKEIIICALCEFHFLTLREKIILLNKLDSSNSIALLSINAIGDMIGRMPRCSSAFNANFILQNARAAAAILSARGISCCLYGQQDYPALLKEISDPPFALFYRGNFSVLQEKCVSIVGTRRLTADGMNAAKAFAYDAALHGQTVVSGLAFGADACSHAGAVAAAFDEMEKNGVFCERCGKTAAVLPCGIDCVVPNANKRIARQILQTGGCLLSEYPPGVCAEKWRFVQRNRIIAGLSPATVIVQAPAGSGALITADFALDFGRDVVFLKSAVSAQAVKVSADSRKINKKLVRTVQQYIADGAPVVKDYEDFKACMKDLPGKHSLQLCLDLEGI